MNLTKSHDGGVTPQRIISSDSTKYFGINSQQDTSSEQKQIAKNLDLHSVIIVNAWSFTVYMYTKYIHSAI